MGNLLFIINVFTSILSNGFSSEYNNTYQNNESTVSIKISEIRNTKGSIEISVYRNQEEFENRKAFKKLRIGKENVKNHKLATSISLPTGNYGIAILDDENNNSKMDMGFLMPKEGFGFSDYYHTGISKPKFRDFTFNLGNNKNTDIRVKYY